MTTKEARTIITTARQMCRDFVAEEGRGFASSYDLWKFADDAERIIDNDETPDDQEIEWEAQEAIDGIIAWMEK